MADRVGIAQAHIDRAPVILKAYGLGSCIAVSLYDPDTGLGGLGHMLLPCRPGKDPVGSERKGRPGRIRTCWSWTAAKAS